jgi:hypothetical protein
MNSIKILLILFIIPVITFNCKEDPIKKAPVIACPIFVLEGDEIIPHLVGTPWTEPGFHCSEIEVGGDDLTASVIIDDSEINVNERGIQTIRYTAVNSIGCSRTVERYLIITSDCGFPYLDGKYTRNFGTDVMYITPASIPSMFDVSKMYSYSGTNISGQIVEICEDTLPIFSKLFCKRKRKGSLYERRSCI